LNITDSKVNFLNAGTVLSYDQVAIADTLYRWSA